MTLIRIDNQNDIRPFIGRKGELVYSEQRGSLFIKTKSGIVEIGSGSSTPETDPVFNAWLTTPPNISTFVNDAGYLTSETDPVYSASSWYSTTNNSPDWNTAFSWGNHASAGYLTSITSGQVTSALGYTPYNATNPSGYITSSSLSSYVPNSRTLTINGTTYDLSANRSWTIATGISSLNGLTDAIQTFATGTTGTDFGIVSSGTTHTFNLPTASASNRGLLSSSDWNTFNNKFTLPALTSGSVPFSNGTTIAQDNSNLFWNNTTKSLGIGTNNTSFPGYDTKLLIQGNGTGVSGRTTFVVKNTSANSAASFMLSNSSNHFVGMSMTGSSYVIGEVGNIFTGSTNMNLMTDGAISTGATSKMLFTTGGWSNQPTMTITGGNPGNVGIGGITSPTARLHLSAGSATANTAPLKFTTGTNTTVAVAGQMEYNNTFHLTNSDATRRHVVLAPNTTKITASAPYTNDGYIIVNIAGTDFKLMTTA